jgi:hypothetical protein
MTFVGDTTRWGGHATLNVPKEAELAALLWGSRGLHERQLNALAIAADPYSGGSTSVSFLATPRAWGHTSEADGVADGLAALLARARAAGDPAADNLAAVAFQLGVPDPGPAPEAS